MWLSPLNSSQLFHQLLSKGHVRKLFSVSDCSPRLMYSDSSRCSFQNTMFQRWMGGVIPPSTTVVWMEKYVGFLSLAHWLKKNKKWINSVWPALLFITAHTGRPYFYPKIISNTALCSLRKKSIIIWINNNWKDIIINGQSLQHIKFKADKQTLLNTKVMCIFKLARWIEMWLVQEGPKQLLSIFGCSHLTGVNLVINSSQMGLLENLCSISTCSQSRLGCRADSFILALEKSGCQNTVAQRGGLILPPAMCGCGNPIMGWIKK